MERNIEPRYALYVSEQTFVFRALFINQRNNDVTSS